MSDPRVRVAFGRGLVENSVSTDDLRVRIRQQRKGDARPIGETPENRRAVVTDRGETEPSLLNFAKILLQLDQLDFAVRSPVGGAKEDQHHSLGPHQGAKRMGRPVLIDGIEVGNL
jgi:hypothetical protein